MRDRRFIIEIIRRPDRIQARVTDYRLGAVRFHEAEEKGPVALLRAILSAGRAIRKRMKENP